MPRSNTNAGTLLSEQFGKEVALGLLHARLKQVVTIHNAMFEKLLFKQQTLPRELTELFADAGATYLKISQELERLQGQSDSMLSNSLKPES